MPQHLEIRRMPIRDLTPAEYNPRRTLKPTDKAYRKLKHSLQTFGLVEPLVWNECTGRVVGGHQRLQVLKDLGYAEVQVSVVNLNEAQERALNVVLNNQDAQGRYDPAMLHDLLSGLRDLPEFEATGFDDGIFRLLNLEPLEELPDRSEANRVEITIITRDTAYEAFRGALDGLVREFDLEVHIQRG